MNTNTKFTLSFLALLICADIPAAQPRSAAAKAEFKRANPCPTNGERRGPCPGYVIDHIDPLCNGGADAPANMQWQTVAEAKEKDKEERRICRLRPRFQSHY